MYYEPYDDIDLQQPLADHPLNDGLALWLLGIEPFAGSRTWYDLCRQNNGTIASSAPWVGNIRHERGIALSFTGSNYVDCAGGTTFDVTTNDFAVGGWVLFANSNQQFMLCKTIGTGGIGYDILLNPGSVAGDISFRTIGSGGVDIGPSSGWNDNRWHSVIGTRKNSTLFLYIDGIQRGSSVPHSDSLSDTSAPFQVSARNGTPLSGTNYLDGVFCYPKRGLTAAEAWEMYEEGRSGYPKTLNRTQRRAAYVPAGAPPAGAYNPYYFRHLAGAA